MQVCPKLAIKLYQTTAAFLKNIEHLKLLHDKQEVCALIGRQSTLTVKHFYFEWTSLKISPIRSLL